MAKAIVERPPEFKFTSELFNQISEFMDKYDVTDADGNYLPWQKLKWRVPKQDAEKIWKTIKFKRLISKKDLPIKDENGQSFIYCLHGSMESKLHEITRTAGGNVGVIGDSSASNSIQKKFLVSSLIMEEAITSAQLEGAATTREIAKKMLEEERAPKNNDERMILNNYLLLLEAERNCNQPLSVDMILEFHRIATQFTDENSVVPGTFRCSDDIFVEDGQGGIAHQPPTHTKIYERLSSLCEFANTDHSGKNGNQFIYPVVKAIILHFMIGYEHPFRDGNGRTARALFYWYMLKNEYHLFKYVSISKLIKDNARKYGLSFLYCEKDDNDLTYFIDFQLDVITKAFLELENYLKVKTEEFNQIVTLLDKSKHSDLPFIQKEILKKGTKDPGRVFTANEIASDYGVSATTARTHLANLVSRKLLLSTKDGKTLLYFAPNDIKSRLINEV